jgi:hypothetical protein
MNFPMLHQKRHGHGSDTPKGLALAGNAAGMVAALKLLLALAMLSAAVSQAQPTSPAAKPRDPLMSLMLAQPKIDLDTPVRAEASFDPPRAQPNQPVVYRVTLNALKDALAWSGHPPEVRGLTFRKGAAGEIMQVVGTNLQPRSAFNFHARPGQPGRYVVPEFVIRAYGTEVKVPAAVLEVSPAARLEPAQKLLVEVSPSRPFVGEAARVRILSPASPSGAVHVLAHVQLNGSGFMQEVTANRQTIETEMVNGQPRPHFIYETFLTPILPGRNEVFAQAFAAGNRFSGPLVITGPATISGASSPYILLDSDPVRLNFRPLPREGRLPGFAGAVGDYSVDPPQLSTNTVRVGEPVKMTVSVRGRGNLGRLAMPPPPRVADWQVFEAKPEQLPPQVVQARGSMNFTYTLVPLKDDVRATPELPFSFFHPDKEQYVSANVRPVPVAVIPGAAPEDLALLLRERLRGGDSGDQPTLGPLATTAGTSAATLVPLQLRPWFPVLQLTPALLFCGLLLWDRRRRFLEAHPHILLRRRARRAVRRHRRQARKHSEWGNDQGFAEASVAAMREASAPHYPAAPQAVTCGDVLALLNGQAPEGAHQVVTSLFNYTNERRFSDTEITIRPETLPLLTDVERILDHLEAKL